MTARAFYSYREPAQLAFLSAILILTSTSATAQREALEAFENNQKMKAKAEADAAKAEERRAVEERIRSTGQGADTQFFKATAPGVVKDIRTGLEWMRCSLGQEWDDKSRTCKGFVSKYSWRQAAADANKINLVGGYAKRADWRLPTIVELESLRYCSNGFGSMQLNLPNSNDAKAQTCVDGSTLPTMSRIIFPGMQSGKMWYWSSTPFNDSGHGAVVAWVVKFDRGEIGPNGLAGTESVRLVRTD
ncbi:MAG: hypothetical protein RIR09_1083 [Pseudomonadota bacterium]|jgi:hypothetical protein